MTIKFYLYHKVNILIINDLLSGVAALDLRHFDLEEEKKTFNIFTLKTFIPNMFPHLCPIGDFTHPY